MMKNTDPCLSGKKTVCFPYMASDMGFINNLYKLASIGKNPIQPEEEVWMITTKEGKASQKIGFVRITPLTKRICDIEVAAMPAYIRNVDKSLRTRKVSFIEDGVTKVIAHLFANNDLYRVQTLVAELNKTAEQLFRNLGFIKEGVMRGYIYNGGQATSTAIYSLIKPDFEREGK